MRRCNNLHDSATAAPRPTGASGIRSGCAAQPVHRGGPGRPARRRPAYRREPAANVTLVRPEVPAAPADADGALTRDSRRPRRLAPGRAYLLPYVLVAADPLAAVAAQLAGYVGPDAGPHGTEAFELRAGEALAAWRANQFELPDYYLVLAGSSRPAAGRQATRSSLPASTWGRFAHCGRTCRCCRGQRARRAGRRHRLRARLTAARPAGGRRSPTSSTPPPLLPWLPLGQPGRRHGSAASLTGASPFFPGVLARHPRVGPRMSDPLGIMGMRREPWRGPARSRGHWPAAVLPGYSFARHRLPGPPPAGAPPAGAMLPPGQPPAGATACPGQPPARAPPARAPPARAPPARAPPARAPPARAPPAGGDASRGHSFPDRFVGVTYTGEVDVGGPADIREIDGVTLAKVAVGPMNNNAYLLRDKRHRAGAADRRGRRGGHPTAAHRRHPGGHDRDHAPASGPLGGTGRGQVGDPALPPWPTPLDAPGIRYLATTLSMTMA